MKNSYVFILFAICTMNFSTLNAQPEFFIESITNKTDTPLVLVVKEGYGQFTKPLPAGKKTTLRYSLPLVYIAEENAYRNLSTEILLPNNHRVVVGTLEAKRNNYPNFNNRRIESQVSVIEDNYAQDSYKFTTAELNPHEKYGISLTFINDQSGTIVVRKKGLQLRRIQ